MKDTFLILSQFYIIACTKIIYANYTKKVCLLENEGAIGSCLKLYFYFYAFIVFLMELS